MPRSPATRCRIGKIGGGGAILVCVVPVGHVQRFDRIACALQAQCGHSRIDTAGKGNDNGLFGRRHSARILAAVPAGTASGDQRSPLQQLFRRDIPDQVGRIAETGQVVIDRTQHHRAAQLWRACDQFVATQPDYPLDTGIQHAMLIVVGRSGRKRRRARNVRCPGPRLQR